MARLYIQCKASNGTLGYFISEDDREPISPIFADLAPLLTWMKENGWSLNQFQAGGYVPLAVQKQEISTK